MSFQLCKDLAGRQAFFIFRVKENLIYTVTETLDFSMPDSTISFFDSIRDELIHYENDKSKATYRLVRFTVNKEKRAIHIARVTTICCAPDFQLFVYKRLAA